MGEFGELGVGQQWVVVEDFVEDVWFLQVVQFFWGVDEGGDGELLVGQQFEEGLEWNQCWNLCYVLVGGGLENFVDFVELGDLFVGQVELFDVVEVFLIGVVFDYFQLLGDQGILDLVFGFWVVDEIVVVGLVGYVLCCFYMDFMSGLWLWGFCCCCCFIDIVLGWFVQFWIGIG